jgi:hypothetical protein
MSTPRKTISDWTRYVTHDYADDCRAFAGGRLDGDIFLCDCGAALQVTDAARAAGVSDPERFTVAAFLEAALRAGVHCYDRPHHELYQRSLPYRFAVLSHAFGGLAVGGPVYTPQLLLASLAPWTDAHVGLVTGACDAPLPRWAQAYDRLVGGRRGTAILGALSRDGDLSKNPWQRLDGRVIEAYRAGLARAAEAA